MNDYFNLTLKLFRHLATLDNKCFAVCLVDDQRDQSLNADFRELSKQINLTSKTDKECLLPAWGLANFIYHVVKGHFDKYYLNMRYIRGDNTLTTYLYKSLATIIINHYERVNSVFSCFKIIGQDVNDSVPFEYYILPKKVYSNRYSTDCDKCFFEYKSKRSRVGILDARTYGNSQMSIGDWSRQNAYLYNKLMKVFFDDEEDVINNGK